MGGHGGLNILPQKRWNVYNFDNREKVRKDEEAAAKEEQLKQEQSRKRDAEFRLEQLRTARGLAPAIQTDEPLKTDKNPGHINLFEGIKIFDPVKGLDEASDAKEGSKRKKMKKEEVPRVVTAEDEKYRLGYGVAGKGVKLPWYLEKKGGGDSVDVESVGGEGSSRGVKEGKTSGKKTLAELREERLKREKREKEREQALIKEQGRESRNHEAVPRDRYYSRW